jgi:NAD(P)H dehydrogenase (quinone)
MIAVIGATGNTGRALVKELLALSQTPVSVVRNAEKAREVLGPAAKVAVAELTDKGALEKALAGVTSVFVVTGHNPQMSEQQVNVQQAAEKAGAQYLVRVSGGRVVVGPDVESVVGRGHHAIEEALKKSKLKWAILRPGLFMQNVLAQAASIKNDSKIVLPFARDQKVALTDVRDTGAIGARILTDPAKHAGKTYEYTGATTTYGEFADVLSEVLGRKITYVGASLEQAEAGMRGRQMPDWLVTHMLSIAKTGAKGGFDNENTQPIRDLVGRPPITARQFALDYKALFS